MLGLYILYIGLLCYGIIFILWLFGTDLYDYISGKIGEHSRNIVLASFIGNVLSVLILYFFIDSNALLITLPAILWDILSIPFLLIIFSYDGLISINKYFLKKRGKL